MTDVRVERLSLKVSGLSGGEGTRLARLIAQGFGHHSAWIDSPDSVDALHVEVTGARDLDLLSERIVAEVMRALDRSI